MAAGKNAAKRTKKAAPKRRTGPVGKKKTRTLKPDVERGLRQALKASGISRAEFNKQFKKVKK